MWCRRPASPSRLIAHRQNRGCGQSQRGAVATAGNRLPRGLGGTIGRHPRLTLPSAAPMHAPSASPQRIARVEPLTLTRAVRGPFDYRLRPEQADVGVGSLLRVPFGGRTTLGVVLELADRVRARARAAGRARRGPPARRPRRPGRRSRGGSPASTARRRRGRSRSCCRREPPAGYRRKRVLVAELTDAGARALRGEARAERSPAGDARGARARRPDGRGRARHPDAAPARGARARGDRLVRPAGAARRRWRSAAGSTVRRR